MTDPQVAILMLGAFIFIILLGFPIAFTLMAMGVFFGYYAYFQPDQAFFDNRVFYLLTQNTFSIMNNDVLVAVPLFLFMGYIVERSNLLDRLFLSLQLAFRAVPIRQNDSKVQLPNPAWKMLFDEAGLEFKNFMKVVSDWEPPVPFDKRITWREFHSDQADVLIRVEDSGPGVPDEARVEIFLPFTSMYGGTGLGLPMARQLLSEMGGTLTLEDSSLGGAAFVVTLRKAADG